MRTRRPLPYLSTLARAPFGPALALVATALGLGLTTRGARAEAPKKDTYALGWTRLAGAEPCIASRDLATGVEKSLKRRVFVSAARADRYVEGRVGPRLGGGWTAALQIADAMGRVLGTRELMSDGPNCRDLDEAITLSVALMIDSNLSAPPPDPLEAGPSDAAVDAIPPGATAPSKPDKDDPWGGAPAKSRAPAPSKPRGPGEEGFELAALLGYGLGAGGIPLTDSSASGLNVGLGLRAGYQFSSGVWLGFGFVSYSGGTFVQAVDPAEEISFQKGNVDPRRTDSFILGSFRAYVPSVEAGYGFALGPLEARPYLGIGFVVYDFSVSSGYSTSDSNVPGYARWEVDPQYISLAHNALKVSVLPGLSVAWPVGLFFVGVDARMMFIVDGGPNFIPSLTAGVRF